MLQSGSMPSVFRYSLSELETATYASPKMRWLLVPSLGFVFLSVVEWRYGLWVDFRQIHTVCVYDDEDTPRRKWVVISCDVCRNNGV